MKKKRKGINRRFLIRTISVAKRISNIGGEREKGKTLTYRKGARSGNISMEKRGENRTKKYNATPG